MSNSNNSSYITQIVTEYFNSYCLKIKKEYYYFKGSTTKNKLNQEISNKLSNFLTFYFRNIYTHLVNNFYTKKINKKIFFKLFKKCYNSHNYDSITSKLTIEQKYFINLKILLFAFYLLMFDFDNKKFIGEYYDTVKREIYLYVRNDCLNKYYANESTIIECIAPYFKLYNFTNILPLLLKVSEQFNYPKLKNYIISNRDKNINNNDYNNFIQYKIILNFDCNDDNNKNNNNLLKKRENKILNNPVIIKNKTNNNNNIHIKYNLIYFRIIRRILPKLGLKHSIKYNYRNSKIIKLSKDTNYLDCLFSNNNYYIWYYNLSNNIFKHRNINNNIKELIANKYFNYSNEKLFKNKHSINNYKYFKSNISYKINNNLKKEPNSFKRIERSWIQNISNYSKIDKIRIYDYNYNKTLSTDDLITTIN